MSSSPKKFLLLTIVGIVVILGLSWLILTDREPPQLAVNPKSGFISQKKVFNYEISDEKAGLGEMTAVIVQGDQSFKVFDKAFTASERKSSGEFSLAGAKLRDGQATLKIEVTDRSMNNFGRGNKLKAEFAFTVDTVPPNLTLLSKTHYINQGGTGCVSFQSSKPLQSAGVVVDKVLYRGYKREKGHYVCFYPFAYNIEVSKFRPKLFAQDEAGNVREAEIPIRPKPKKFKEDSINLGDSFLHDVQSKFQKLYPEEKDPVKLYLKVNRELRDRNLQEIWRLGQNSTADILWKGAFVRLPNAAPRAAFADRRSYLVKGEKIDDQTHLGVDLASLEMADVPAANGGVVLFTGDMGIYGLTVLIDHGMGVQSLYAHLSAITKKAGDKVARGEVIARTGKTGLAGGDHLHFQIMVWGFPVNPIEWWDAHWIKDNVADRIDG